MTSSLPLPDRTDRLRDGRVAREDVVERLQAAIRRRHVLRPGSPAHWSNECEIKVLQRALTERPPLVGATGPAPDLISS